MPTIELTDAGELLNEYGTPVSAHKCISCGRWFTVCPAKDPRSEHWQGCLGLDCESYDVDRDVDLMWEIEPWRMRRDDDGD